MLNAHMGLGCQLGLNGVINGEGLVSEFAVVGV